MPGTVDRDRDGTGRARNARPRDALGRPLPYGSPDVARQREGLVRTPAETLDEAQRLLDARLPFHAHEVFEDAWKSSADPDRALWKGLAQLAVALTHLARGNVRGARALLDRGREAIRPFVDGPAGGVDVVGLLQWSADLQAELDAGTPPGQSWTVPVLRASR